MLKLCPDCDGAYGQEWDMCPVCYPAKSGAMSLCLKCNYQAPLEHWPPSKSCPNCANEIVSNTKSNETACTKCGKSFWVYNHPALKRSAHITECPSCYEKSINRAKELKSGIQEKIDFGGIKLLPEKTPKYYNPFGPKPGDQIYGIGEDGKPTLKTVDSYGNYIEYNNSGKSTDPAITLEQVKAAVAALKGSAIIPSAEWLAANAQFGPLDYTEYNGPGLAKLLPEKES